MAVAKDVALKCACGAVTGVASGVDPTRGNRLVCMCDDCQAYAHWLDPAATLLDPNGGTEVFQLTPAQVRITAGREHIRCVRLSETGLMRWYAGCCKTPLANTLGSARAPFMGLLVVAMVGANDEVLGPIRARIQARYGKPPLPPGSYSRAPLGLIFRSIRRCSTPRVSRSSSLSL